MRPLADATETWLTDDTRIQARYPIVWFEQPGPTYAGSISLGPASLTLDGVSGGERQIVELAYADLERVRMAGMGDERVSGRPTLVLTARPSRIFRLAAVAGAGVMREVADALTREMTVA
jgi:hypothetical protein